MFDREATIVLRLFTKKTIYQCHTLNLTDPSINQVNEFSLKRLHELAKSKCQTGSNSSSSVLKYLVMLLSSRPTLT